MTSADRLIERLQLAPHPEGGWYRETWRAEPDNEGRAKGTAILFLLKSGETSHWHKVDADELWLWQDGDPLDLSIAQTDTGPVQTLTLGRDIADGQCLQGMVPAGAWQAASAAPAPKAGHGYTLVSCIVVPGFDFAGFVLAAPGWEPGKKEQS
jgi:predicted cupin superfamily sugar epimerase